MILRTPKPMMKKLSVFIATFILIIVSITSIASAHVVVQPAQVGVASFQVFSVNVPAEKAVPTVSLRLLIPSGLDEVIPTVKNGWTISTKLDKNGAVNEIDWTGGSIPPNFRDEFTFSAQVPAQPTELKWKAYQTYQNGAVVSWDATPAGSDDATGNKGPYSITHVVNDLNPPESSAASNNAFPYLLSASALGIALLAFVRTFSVKRKL
jgi:uncharacterized protein YcnI